MDADKKKERRNFISRFIRYLLNEFKLFDKIKGEREAKMKEKLSRGGRETTG